MIIVNNKASVFTKPCSKQKNPKIPSVINTANDFECEVIDVKFRSDTGFCILYARPAGTNEEIVLRGTFINNPVSGNILQVKGAWENNPRYGIQFKVKECKSRLPETREGMIRYLSSDFIPGVGPKLATSIVDFFGSETMDIVMHTPDRLYEVKGVGAKKGRKIIDSWISQRKAEEFITFIEGHGLNYYQGMAIFKYFKNNAMSQVLENPYVIINVPGITFANADGLAEAMGESVDSDFRIHAAVKCALTQCLESGGHTCIPMSALKSATVRLLGKSGFKYAKIGKTLYEYADDAIAAMDKELVVLRTAITDEPMVSFITNYDTEKQSASILLKQLKRQMLAPAPVNTAKLLKRYEGQIRIELSQDQKEAILRSAASPISVITGGPGTGKTTIIKALIEMAKNSGKSVGLAAPTGRAAHRMEEATGHEAMTLHRMFGIIPADEGNSGIIKSQAVVNNDLLIIDESSMMDSQMFWHIMTGIENKTGVIFVGDVDQLPSIGSGNVLADLINSGVIPVSRLTSIHRQQKDSGIISAAYDINNGNIPTEDQYGQFLIIEQENPATAVEIIKQIIADASRKKLNLYSDIQVLTPQHAGMAGTDRLNQELKKFYRTSNSEIQSPWGSLSSGDKVMQTENDYNRCIYNGDPGIVTDVNLLKKEVTIQFDKPQTFKIHELESIKHAAAVTIHKSQGMEYPIVVIPILSEHSAMLYRRLLYTAVTRASQKVILVGSKSAIAQAVNNNRSSIRYTTLGQLLNGIEPVRMKRYGVPAHNIEAGR